MNTAVCSEQSWRDWEFDYLCFKLVPKPSLSFKAHKSKKFTDIPQTWEETLCFPFLEKEEEKLHPQGMLVPDFHCCGQESLFLTNHLQDCSHHAPIRAARRLTGSVNETYQKGSDALSIKVWKKVLLSVMEWEYWASLLKIGN